MIDIINEMIPWYHWDTVMYSSIIIIILAIPAYLYGKGKRKHERKLKQAKRVYKK